MTTYRRIKPADRFLPGFRPTQDEMLSLRLSNTVELRKQIHRIIKNKHKKKALLHDLNHFEKTGMVR